MLYPIRVCGAWINSFALAVIVSALTLLSALPAAGQINAATLNGVVTDSSGAVVPKAALSLENTATGTVRTGVTNGSGEFIMPSLDPGTYALRVEKQGFAISEVKDINLHVAANVALEVKLKVGSTSEQVTVDASSAALNTTNGTVSTVIDHTFIENMPLNGSDLQTLFELTPGTLLNAGGVPDSGGGFSVDGQRPTANYTMVDGVSANAYIPTQAGTPNTLGSGIATSASGGTNGILPVDAIEEFRMDTSTYTAENGRSPGGQIQIRTRSGTNQFHGTLFEQFRNQILDADDWFTKYDNLAQSQLRMNEFGGTLGGPVAIPHLYDGRNRLFFFVANDNLIFDQPVTESNLEVPDASVLSGAYSAFKAWLPVFPTGNGGQIPNTPSFDYFNGSYPDLIRDYTTSVRMDAQLPRSIHAFFRANIAPSSANEEANAATRQGAEIHINTYTGGMTIPLGTRIVNDLNANYTGNDTEYELYPASIGGNSPDAIQSNLPNGVNLSSSELVFDPYYSSSAYSQADIGPDDRNALHMWNLVDTLSLQLGKNTLKAGIDFLSRESILRTWSDYYLVLVDVPPAPPYTNADIDTGLISELFTYEYVANPTISSFNTSLFVNDDWKTTPFLTLNAGLRWELNPAPNVGPLGTLAFADSNTNLATFQDVLSTGPLYRNVYSNFAPRFGFAWTPRPNSGTVVRGGAGIYFDTGQAATAAGTTANGYPYQNTQTKYEVPYTSVNWSNPAGTASAQALTNFHLVSPTLLSPRTYEWSLTLDQAFGKYAKLTMSYVGNDGEQLVGEDEFYNAKNSAGQYPFPTTTVSANGDFYLVTNQSHSNYQALQTQLTSQIGQRLSALVSYTWEHAEDNGSNDFATVSANLPHYPIANSAYDIPQIFATAIHYAPEGFKSNRILQAVTGGWALDTIARLQSASPFTVTAGNTTNDLIYGVTDNANVVPGVPAVLHEHINPYSGKAVPGNKLLNWAAFTAPPVNSSGVQTSNGDSPTNGYRLFGLKQWDLAASRTWKIWEGLNLNFRVDAFNILNTANFYIAGGGWTSTDSSTFGVATSTYATGYGGTIAGDGVSGSQLSAFQNGGPRELQLSMKLKF